MKRKITLIATGFFLGLLSLQAQTTCSDDKVAYVNSKNTGGTGAYTLSIGAEEKASQAYHYSGPGKVGGARVFGDVPGFLGVVLKVSLYYVDANDRPTGPPVATAPLKYFYPWSPPSFDVSFSPAASVDGNFAIVVEVIDFPGWGNDFALTYTGNGEGLGEDLASLAGTSTGFNWASAMTAFSKDGDFYLYPRMIHFNTPNFSIASLCVNTGTPIAFANNSQLTTDPMFNTITSPAYSGSNFLYTWNFGDGSPVSHSTSPSHAFSAPGVYTVSLTTVIDGWDIDCSKTYTKTISVGLSAATSSVTNVTCNGSNNGTVIVLGAGGATPYTYSVDDRPYQSSAYFNGLTANTYPLSVKDNLGCIQTTSFTITQPAPIQFTSATSTNASCGNSDGGILVISSGGIGPMQYQLNSGPFQSSGVFSGLAACGYLVTAKDANGCTFSDIIVVNDLGGPEFFTNNSTNVSCFGGNDGSISLSSLGGTGAIQYSINGGTTFQTSGIFTNIVAGTYTVIVKDAATCSDVDVITIGQPQQLSFSALSTPVSCFGGSNGQINISQTTGGTGSISYSLDGVSFQSGTVFPGLTAGIYTVYAKDIAGCLKTISVTVVEPTVLTASVSVVNTACYGYQDGVITIVGSGGTPGYTYGIGDDEEFQSTGSFGNLEAGTFPLIVEDANGCIYTISASISQPTIIVLSATPTNSTCGNSNGGMLVTASGGSGSGYTYSINGGSFGSGSFSGLPAATYVVTAMDGTGCTSVKNVTIFDSNGPSILSSTNTNVSCNGGNDGTITVGTVSGGTGVLQYSLDGITYQTSPVFTGLPAGTYNVIVKDAVGCIGSVSITLTQPSAFVMTANIVNASCYGSSTGAATLLVGGGAGTLAYSINGGVTYQSSNTFTNLASGSYTLIVKDAGGCLGYTTINITQPNAILAFYGSLNVSCSGANNGTLNIIAWGGVGPFQYSLNGITYQSSNTFAGLPGGAYVVFIKDANGCVKTMSASVYEPAALTVDATVTDITCSGGDNGVIDLSIGGGLPTYYFDWSNGVDTEDNFNLTAGTYTVIVSDKNGCSTTMSYTVTEPAIPVIVNGTVANSTGSNNGSIDVTVNGGVGGYTFLWSNGMTTEDVSGLAPGVYSVIVTDGNGCAASSTFVVTSTAGIEDINFVSDQTFVYPNPASDFVVISVVGFRIDKVEIYDVLGQIAYTGEPKNSKVEISTSELQQGVYFVKILVDDKLITKKMKVIR